MGRRGRILVIDDEPAIGRLLARVLGGEHDVCVETDGAVGLARLRGGQVFDVVLCDLMMPGVRGAQVHAEIGRIVPELLPRVVIMTGGALDDPGRAFLAALGTPTLRKPFDVNAVRALVRSLVDKAP